MLLSCEEATARKLLGASVHVQPTSSTHEQPVNTTQHSFAARYVFNKKLSTFHRHLQSLPGLAARLFSHALGQVRPSPLLWLIAYVNLSGAHRRHFPLLNNFFLSFFPPAETRALTRLLQGKAACFQKPPPPAAASAFKPFNFCRQVSRLAPSSFRQSQWAVHSPQSYKPGCCPR